MTGTLPSVDSMKLSDHGGLLVGGQERAFAGMAEHDQALDAVEAAEPGAQALDGGVVDGAVAGERGDGGGNETSEIEGFHVDFLQVACGGWVGAISRRRLLLSWLSAPGTARGGFVVRRQLMRNSRRTPIPEDTELDISDILYQAYPETMPMDYAAWKLFIDAAELGSLSKVAVAYGTSQPHISRQIGELEQECGGRLFQRTGRGVVLTELGQRIAPKVRAWLASTEQLANDVRTSAGTPIGKVRIGSLPSTAHPLVTTLCKRLQERYPLVQLAVREGQGAQLETWLEDGSVDLAILFRTSPSPEERRHLPRRDADLPRERDRRPADVAADGTVLGAAQPAARAVLPAQQLARSPRPARATSTASRSMSRWRRTR